MNGFVDTADHRMESRGRSTLWAVLAALLVGVGLALASPSFPPIDERSALAAAEDPWGGTAPLDPQAEAADLPLAAVDPAGRGRPAPSSGPERPIAALAAAPSAPMEARAAPAVRPGPARGLPRPALLLAYDSQGPPFSTH